MSQEYRVKSYHQGDEEQIVPLLINAFKEWPFFDVECSPLDHWRWKYLDNPDYKNMLLHVVYGDKIVSAGHNILCNVLIKSKQYSAAYGTDACVLPSFQGRGLYRKLCEAYIDKEQEDKVHFIYMVTNNLKVLNSKCQQRATPYRFPYKIKYLSRIEDLGLHAQAHDLGFRWKLRQIVERARSSPIRPPNSDLRLKTVTKFDETITDFLERIHESYDFIRMRTIDNLNWRYLDPRGGNYRVRAVIENGKILGYGVFRINKKEEYHVGYIVDLLALPNRLDNAEALLLDGLTYFRENHVNNVLYQVVENHPYEKLVSKYGFSGGEANRHFFYNNWGYDGKRLEKISPEKFHFVFGDITGI
jgi:GNAT superfamily N-acetyltransferase